MPNKITVFTGSVLADAIADELPRSPLGVIAGSLPPFDIPTAVEELGNRVKKPIRLALLGEAAATAPKGNTRTPITTSETTANKWRNDSEAINGHKLVVLAVGPVSKLRSLQSSLTHVTEAKLRRAIRNRAIGWSSIEARKVLWEILASDFDRFPTTRLCEFGAEVAQIVSRGNKHDVPDYEINNLFRLGLLQHAQLLQEEGPAAIRRLLAANSHLVDRLRAPTKEDKSRVGRAAEDDRDSLSATARKLLAFMRSPTLACLQGIEFGQTLRVLAPTPPTPDDTGNPPQPQDTPKKENRLGDELAVEDILETGGENLDDARDHFDPPEGEDPEDEFDFGGRKVVHSERPGKSQTACLLARFFTETTFGAYVEASTCSEYVEALNALAAEETESVKEFRPRQAADPHALETLLQKIVKRGLPKACQDVLAVWSRHLELRNQLLPHASELVDHPLLSLCQDASLLDTADQLVKNYGLLAKQIDDVRKAIETDSPESAKRLVSKLLSTDVVFLKLRGSAFVAIAGPTHPFHLWRWVETAKLLKSNREELANLDRDLVVKLASNPPVSSPHLLLTQHIEGVAKETVFLAVGAIAALPLYSDPESRTAARFQVKGLAEVADKLLASAPHASNGFEVVAIDPPSPADLLHALEDLSPAYSTESPIPVHLRILRTRKAPTMLDEEDESMDNLLVDLRETGGSIQVEPGQLAPEELVSKLQQRPAHYVVIFEPGDAQAFRVGTDTSPTLSPLVIPRSYKYDDLEDRFDVVLAGNATPFGGYYDLFCHMQNMPTTNTIGRRSGASTWLPLLGRLGQHTFWFSIVDQGLEPTMRIDGAARLDKRHSGGRDIYTFSCHARRLDRTVRRIIEAAGLIPDDQLLQITVGSMRRLGGDTFPAAMSASLSGKPFAPQARGIMGVVAVAAWHEAEQPNSLLISLDSDAARKWILGNDPEDRRRGDLLCLRQTQSGIHLEVIEVKVRDDSQSVFQAVPIKGGKRIQGHAIDQIDNVVAVLKRILPAGDLSGIDRARHEILRDQLYMAIATREMDSDSRGRAARLLQEFFHNGPDAITGRLFVVNLETNTKRHFPSKPVESGTSPNGHAIEVYKLVQSDLPDDLASSAPPAATTPPPPPKPPGKAGPQPPEKQPKTQQATKSKKRPSPPPTDPAPKEPPQNVRVFIGHDPAGAEVWWNSAANPNFGVLVTGDSGMGKSQTIRAFIQALRQQGLPVLVFDFKNDYASSDFAKPLGLKVYDVVRNGLPFNPLSLMGDENGEAQPIRQCHELAAIIARVEGLKEQQQNRLVEAQKRAYEKHGIEPRQRIQADSVREEPVFDEILAEMADMNDAPAKTAMFRLQKFSDLGLFPAHPPKFSFEQLLQQGVVLTLNDSANDNLMRILAEILIVKLHAVLKRGDQPRILKRALVLDEAWRVAKSERLTELAREGRAFGVSLLIGSQFPDDLPENLVGNLRTQIFLHNKSPDMRKAVARVLCSASSGAQAQRLIETLGSLPQFQGYLVGEEYKPWIRVNIVPHKDRPPETRP